MIFKKFKFSEGKIITFTVIGMILVLVISIILIGLGAVRHVSITFKEVIKATVAFRNIEGDVKVVGIVGNTGNKPDLGIKNRKTEYSLTVINEDKQPHMFYIDRLNVHTKLLRFGENDTITIQQTKEAIYNYYDRSNIQLL